MPMEKGENNASIAMMLEVTNVVKRHSGTTKQKNGFWLMHEALMGSLTPEFWINEFEKDYPSHGKEIYDKMVEHYAKTNIQQRAEREIEEQDKQTRNEVRQEANLIIAKRHLEHWKQKYAENPNATVFQKRIQEAEEEVIKAGGQP